MLVVNVELWPYGNESEKKTIAKMGIANDGTSGSSRIGNYVAVANTDRGDFEVGAIKNHDRRYDVWELVYRVIQEMSSQIDGFSSAELGLIHKISEAVPIEKKADFQKF